MNLFNKPSQWYLSASLWCSVLALTAVSAIVLGCGGGGGISVAGVGSGGTGINSNSSFTSGPISGFGSIIVNGIRYDETAAAALGGIKDEDGKVADSKALKLGMVVQIEGSAITGASPTLSATATTLTFTSELVGRIENIGTNSFVVLGQTIEVTASTFFDDSLVGGLSALKKDDLVEVYGLYNPASNILSATRVEKTTANANKLSGVVSSLNTASQTFKLGTVVVSYAGITPASQVPVLSNGQQVRVQAKRALNIAGQVEATRIRLQGFGVGNRDEVSLEGVVTAFTNTTAFSVNGVSIDASSAKVSGSAAVSLGARLEVEGSTAAGNILVARKVAVKTKAEDQAKEFEITGTVTSVNAASQTFKVREVTIDYAGTAGQVRFENGSEADLLRTPAPIVEVKGALSGTGTVILAQRIKFK